VDRDHPGSGRACAGGVDGDHDQFAEQARGAAVMLVAVANRATIADAFNLTLAYRAFGLNPARAAHRATDRFFAAVFSDRCRFFSPL
jgi:hypothetical protein